MPARSQLTQNSPSRHSLPKGSGPASAEQAAALEFLDRRRRWVGGAPVREAVLGALQEACPDSQFPQYTLLSRLIRHLATAGEGCLVWLCMWWGSKAGRSGRVRTKSGLRRHVRLAQPHPHTPPPPPFH